MALHVDKVASRDGRQAAYHVDLSIIKTECGYDLNTTKFGGDTGVDRLYGFWYARIYFGPFQFAVIVNWGHFRKIPEDKNKEAKG